MNSPVKPEILAPAGTFDAAISAAEAGADAVYFGLSDFNARKRAENIKLSQLEELVQKLHSKNVKAYLTLNTDISQRELSEAARCLYFAKIADVDAFIVKDLAFFEFQNYFKDIQFIFHLSTQAAISTSAGAIFAKKIGVMRVIVARELNRDEIKNIVEKSNIEVEVFVQGAMCFSISGRCLLSSWLGGRSGNRGLCASPCRMEWKIHNNGNSFRIMSMKDLSLLSHLKDLAKIGVKAFKIEGRLKSPDWVAKAVKLVKNFRDELYAENSEVSELGAYAGREMTDYYYLGLRDNLTANAGREKSDFIFSPFENRKVSSISILVSRANGGNKVIITFSLFQMGEQREIKEELFIKRKDYSRKKNLIGSDKFQEYIKNRFNTFDLSIDMPLDIVITYSDYEKIVSKVSALIEKSKKPQRDIAKITLPSELINRVKNITAQREFPRGDFGFELLRLFPEQLKLFDNFEFDFKFIIECKKIDDAKFAKSILKHNFIIALPEVFYENDLTEVDSIIKFCNEENILLEVNNLDALGLFEVNSIQWAAGPGLMILNSLAGDFLKAKGASYAVISMEADEEKVSDLAMTSEIPLVLYVFGRPKLMLSRARISEKAIKISERRGCELNLVNRGGLSIIYPEIPFRLNISKRINAIFAIDLMFSRDPVCEIRKWQNLSALDFNFSSKLK